MKQCALHTCERSEVSAAPYAIAQHKHPAAPPQPTHALGCYSAPVCVVGGRECASVRACVLCGVRVRCVVCVRACFDA